MTDSLPRPGALVMVDIAGTELASEEARFLREQGIRAVCLFRRNLRDEAQARRLTAGLREVLGEEALIAVDQEGGSVLRATFLPQAPSAMALGAGRDESTAAAVGAAVGRGLASLGVNWNFAPVLDVNNNPANPVIGDRSFGEDPQAVARMAGAWMDGALRSGVACCVKHFPGHGDTQVDSHRELPVVDKPLADLRALEFKPFAALAARAPAVMTAHILYPALDAEHPATLSRAVLSGLLRDELGMDGVVITDSLVMKAIYDRYGHGDAAVRALEAGADMVMALGPRADQAAAVAAIETAMHGGRLAPAALQRSQRRLRALVTRYPVRWSDYAAEQRESDERLMTRAWAQGLTGIGAPQAPARTQALRVITQRVLPSDGVHEAGLSGERVLELFSAFGDVEPVLVEDLARLPALPACGEGRQDVLVSNQRERYAPASGRMLRPALHLALWNPYHVLDVAAPAVLSWGYAEGALAALRAWLEGRAGLPGVAPIRLDAAGVRA